MHTTTSLPARHQQICRMVFADPLSPAITWSALRALLEQVGDVAEEPYGILRVTRRRESLVVRRPVNGMESTPELLAGIREFFERTQVVPPAAARTGDWLVVIDRREARVFRSVADGAAAQLVRFHPAGEEAQEGQGRKFDANGRERPCLPGFFEPLRGLLRGARRILIFRRANNVGDEASPFVGWLRDYHPEIARRIVAIARAELEDSSDAVLLAQARRLYRDVAELLREPPGAVGRAGDS